MQSYPFTSDKITYDEHGLPKYDRAVDSAFLRKVFAQYFSDGVFYSSANALQVVADTGMQVAVEPGSCHIQGAIGIETNRRTLVVQAAEEMDRIDTVVARLDLSLAVRSIDLYVVKGTAAESPQAPALTRDSTIWELGLANLFVAKNVATISQQRITDTRLDTSRCGQVGAPVQPPFDTEAFFSQLEAAIQAHQEGAEAQLEQLRLAIEAVEGDAAWMMKDLYDPAGLGKDVTVQTYTHARVGTVHEFTGYGANGRALMTADVQAGDTFTVNGTPVTAYMGAEDATGSMAGSAWNGKWVSFIVEDGALNFKGGGGLSAVDRAKLIPGNIRAGVVLFEGTSREVVGSHDGAGVVGVFGLAGGEWYSDYVFGGKWSTYGPTFEGSCISQIPIEITPDGTRNRSYNASVTKAFKGHVQISCSKAFYTKVAKNGTTVLENSSSGSNVSGDQDFEAGDKITISWDNRSRQNGIMLLVMFVRSE